MPRSSSSVETPIASAFAKAASVFSGASPRAPRWPCKSKGLTPGPLDRSFVPARQAAPAPRARARGSFRETPGPPADARRPARASFPPTRARSPETAAPKRRRLQSPALPMAWPGACGGLRAAPRSVLCGRPAFSKERTACTRKPSTPAKPPARPTIRSARRASRRASTPRRRSSRTTGCRRPIAAR